MNFYILFKEGIMFSFVVVMLLNIVMRHCHLTTFSV